MTRQPLAHMLQGAQLDNSKHGNPVPAGLKDRPCRCIPYFHSCCSTRRGLAAVAMRIMATFAHCLSPR